jgi:hypothetical protein
MYLYSPVSVSHVVIMFQICLVDVREHKRLHDSVPILGPGTPFPLVCIRRATRPSGVIQLRTEGIRGSQTRRLGSPWLYYPVT